MFLLLVESPIRLLPVRVLKKTLGAASAVGDDRLQKAAQGYVVPDSFTHGSSEQRMRWFRRGLESGDIRQGDTFSSSNVRFLRQLREDSAQISH